MSLLIKYYININHPWPLFTPLILLIIPNTYLWCSLKYWYFQAIVPICCQFLIPSNVCYLQALCRWYRGMVSSCFKDFCFSSCALLYWKFDYLNIFILQSPPPYYTCINLYQKCFPIKIIHLRTDSLVKINAQIK